MKRGVIIALGEAAVGAILIIGGIIANVLTVSDVASSSYTGDSLA